MTISWNTTANSVTLNIEDTPHFELVQLSARVDRRFNETELSSAISYKLKEAAKTNRLDVSLRSSSNMEANTFEFETKLKYPSFNALLQQKVNKYTGDLISSNFKFGKTLR